MSAEVGEVLVGKKAVDVSQLALRIVLRDFEVSNVSIGSEEVAGGRRVSTIEIRMKRKA